MRLLMTSFVIPLILFSSAWAATPEETFEKVYGEQFKKVMALRDPAATQEFARGLIKDAGDLKDDAKFQAIVYMKAYEIAFRAAAYSEAEEAMERLASAQPERRREADDKLIIALGRDRGPGARAKLEATRARVIAEKKLDQLEHAVDKAPNKKDAAEVVRLLLVEFDDPAKASTYAAATGDSALQRIVMLAGKNAADLPEQDAKDLGDWYQSRSTAASAGGRAMALGRAKSCYERFLSLHATNDASRLDVKRRLEALAQVEAAQSYTSAVSGNVVDLLKLVDVTSDVEKGKWTRDDDGITSAAQPASLRLPYEPPAQYDMRVVFTARTDRGMAGVMFAQNDATGFFRVDWSTGKCWFETSNMPPKTPRDVQIDKKFAVGSKHEIIIKARKGSMLFYLDGKQMMEMTGDLSRLTVVDYWFIGARSIGIGTHNGTATFHTIELAEVSGHGKPSPKAAK